MNKNNSFDTVYNARHLKPEEVPENFVCTQDFEELVKNNHTVILGARGCGKTTMMKMLTIPALKSWKGKKAEEIQRSISFLAVYISTDIYWKEQQSSYLNQLSKFTKYQQLVSQVAVTTNILYALCETFENAFFYNIVENNDKLEEEFSKVLIKEWKLPPTVPSVDLIKEKLLSRISELNSHIQKLIFNSKTEDTDSFPEYFYLDYHSTVDVAITAYERVYKIKDKFKWALCFDELELAPTWLQERLFKDLRSTTQKILYKLSASPIVSISKELIATPGNDLKLIKMWPHELGKKYEDFSQEIVELILKKKFGKKINPEVLFGTNSILESNKKNETGEYEQGSKTWKEIKKLAEEDITLRQLLIKHQIDPENPTVNKNQQKKLDSVLRKIKPIVYFRNYYSIWDETKKIRISRSRKSDTLFYGKEVLFKICDGNPRWLIGIVNEMLKQTNGNHKIKEPDQSAILSKISEQFYSIIKTAPGVSFDLNSKNYTLSNVLDEIGKYFFSEIAINSFPLDPHGTFKVDEQMNKNIISVLEIALYHGAIVLVDPSQNTFDFEIKGKRFRLSYLLSPKYKIPLRTYSEMSLSKYVDFLSNKNIRKGGSSNLQTEIPL